jgi:parallel beta-helix repeat protein/predicted outer membrane repeat protein
MTRIPLILSLLALWPASALAQNTWYVPNDFPTIQAGIDGVANGDTVIVRDGTYVENINFNGMAITLKSENGPSTTIIDGRWGGSVVTFNSGEGSNSVFDGFTVTEGTTTYGGGMLCNGSSPTLENCTFTGNEADYGGGMYYYSSSPTLNHCTFTDNTAEYGGGMFCWWGSSPTLENCTFTNNTADFGSGMHSWNSTPTLGNCTFTGNTAANYGGGMLCSDSSPTLNHCTFTDNMASTGGGMYCDSSSPALENCTFTDNMASTGGGMYCYNSSSPTLDNCTFTNNTATNGGGGMWCNSSSPTLLNCILWDNHAPNGSEIHVFSGSPTVTYSDVKGGWSGTGNIDADPLFVDPLNNDFNLQSDSPCIDAGDPNGIPDPDGTIADMGAFYYDQRSPILSVNNLVAGQQALVEVHHATPNRYSHFAWSLHGGGPTFTPWGDAMVTAPFHVKIMPTDATGYASYIADVPVSAAGLTVWCHGTDAGTQSMLNALMLVIQ